MPTFLLALPLLGACYDPLYGVPLDGEETAAASTGLPADVEAVLTGSCAGSSCHVGGSTPPAMTYDDLVDVASGAGAPYISPGDPDGSYLYAKVTDTQDTLGGGGSKMPIGGSLDEAALTTLSTWIADGALPAE